MVATGPPLYRARHAGKLPAACAASDCRAAFHKANAHQHPMMQHMPTIAMMTPSRCRGVATRTEAGCGAALVACCSAASQGPTFARYVLRRGDMHRDDCRIPIGNVSHGNASVASIAMFRFDSALIANGMQINE